MMQKKRMEEIIETHPTVIAARAEIANKYNEYHKAVIAHHFKRASDLTKCIKKKEKELRITIRNLEQSLC